MPDVDTYSVVHSGLPIDVADVSLVIVSAYSRNARGMASVHFCCGHKNPGSALIPYLDRDSLVLLDQAADFFDLLKSCAENPHISPLQCGARADHLPMNPWDLLEGEDLQREDPLGGQFLSDIVYTTTGCTSCRNDSYRDMSWPPVHPLDIRVRWNPVWLNCIHSFRNTFWRSNSLIWLTKVLLAWPAGRRLSLALCRQKTGTNESRCRTNMNRDELMNLIQSGKMPELVRADYHLMSEPDDRGWTPLHAAAYSEVLDEVPKELLSLENLCAKNSTGMSVVLVAASLARLDQVPTDCLTNRTIDDRDQSGRTVIGQAAYFRQLDLIPKLLLTRERLILPRGGSTLKPGVHVPDTPLHIAAAYGRLDQIPWELIQADDLWLEDQRGLSVVNLAALMGFLKQIPKHFLTGDVRRQRDTAGLTVPLACAGCGVWPGWSAGLGNENWGNDTIP